MLRILTLALAILIFYSCDTEQEKAIEIPDNIDLDINNDGIVDYQIVYSQQTEGFPIDPGGLLEVIRGKIVSLNNNQLLKKEGESMLFLDDISLIQDAATSPLFWSVNEDAPVNTIVIIREKFDGETWQDEWRIVNDEIKESYFIGFKLIDNNTSALGYLELSIDQQVGEVELLDVDFL